MKLTELSDRELVAACGTDRREMAVEEFHRRYAGFVHSVCFRQLESPQDAEDATIACFLVFLKEVHRLEMVESLGGWFHRCALNAARELRRTRVRRERREKEYYIMKDDKDSADRWQKVLPALEGRIARLPTMQREMIVLEFYRGLSRREIARQLDCAENTVHNTINIALGKLRTAMRNMQIEMEVDDIEGCLGMETLVLPLPATLAARVAVLAAGGEIGGVPSSLAHSTMRAMSWAKAQSAGLAAIGLALVGAGVLTVAQAVGGDSGQKAPKASSELSPAVSAFVGKPAPINEYKGMQEREDVFEFTQKPVVAKNGDKWTITFASKGKCDATVSILDKDGKVVRHLASGVLGANAPHPFQQNSLSQRIEWDGLRDDFSRADLTGGKVKVSLGLSAVFERNVAYSHYDMTWQWTGRNHDFNPFYAEGVDGIAAVSSQSHIRLFDKDRKYLRTLWPPSAADIEKLAPQFAWKMVETVWGDKVSMPPSWFQWQIEGGKHGKTETEAIKLLAGIDGAKRVPFAETKLPYCEDRKHNMTLFDLGHKNLRLAVDPATGDIYSGGTEGMGVVRYEGKTGRPDLSWKPAGGQNAELCMGPDGMLYTRLGIFAYGKWIVRFNRAGEMVPFKENGTSIPPKTPMVVGSLQGKPGVLWTGVAGHSNTHQRGLYISPAGEIIAGINEVEVNWAREQGLYDGPNTKGDVSGTWAAVWNKDGKLLSGNAVGTMQNGHGVAMDRDGNIYVTFGQTFPAEQKCLYGLKDVTLKSGCWRKWEGAASIVKFRGLGGKYPLNVGPAMQMIADPQNPKRLELPGAVWAYGGFNQAMGCTCNNHRWTMDYWARLWVPAQHLYSIMVVDSNGNKIVRLGRYGNVDDTEADLKEKKDGLRFAWARTVAVTDTAVYVGDAANRRVLQAALRYAVEETAILQ